MVAFANPQAYELWMGRWSERLAPAFVDFAGLEPGGRYLDVGAGTGVLGRAVVERFGAAEVVGIEPADSFVAYARDTHRNPRLRFLVGDAQAIAFADDGFDGALALLILQELPDAPLAVREMVRVTRRGGTVATSQWDFHNGFPFLSHFWAAAGRWSRRRSPARKPRHGCLKGFRTPTPWPACGPKRAWSKSRRPRWRSRWILCPSTTTGIPSSAAPPRPRPMLPPCRRKLAGRSRHGCAEDVLAADPTAPSLCQPGPGRFGEKSGKSKVRKQVSLAAILAC